jgi:hypothetical protein
MRRNVFRCLIVCAALAGANVAKSEPPAPPAAAQSAPETVESIDVKPGDRWTYHLYDDITGEFKSTQGFTVTEVRDGTFTVQATGTPANSTQTTKSLYVFDDKWNLLQDAVWKRTPGSPSSGLRIPLEVGAQWETKTTIAKHDPEVNSETFATSKVTGRETVALRSGASYEVFRIEVVERESSPGAFDVHENKWSIWFAPAVNRYVMRTLESRTNGRLSGKYTEFLVSYTRRKEW